MAKEKLTEDQILQKLKELSKECSKSKNITERRYNNQRVVDFINRILKYYPEYEDMLNQISYRFRNMENYAIFYNYGLQENLNDLKTIVADSVEASPVHRKRLQLEKTSIVQTPYGLY